MESFQGWVDFFQSKHWDSDVLISSSLYSFTNTGIDWYKNIIKAAVQVRKLKSCFCSVYNFFFFLPGVQMQWNYCLKFKMYFSCFIAVYWACALRTLLQKVFKIAFNLFNRNLFSAKIAVFYSHTCAGLLSQSVYD